jgi:hypothetical protein
MHVAERLLETSGGRVMSRRVEPSAVVHARLQGWQEAEVCRCEDCVAWDVTEPPVWVPAPAERVNGVWTRMSQQLHGFALLENLRAAEAFTRNLDAMREREQFRGSRR